MCKKCICSTYLALNNLCNFLYFKIPAFRYARWVTVQGTSSCFIYHKSIISSQHFLHHILAVFTCNSEVFTVDQTDCNV